MKGMELLYIVDDFTHLDAPFLAHPDLLDILLSRLSSLFRRPGLIFLFATCFPHAPTPFHLPYNRSALAPVFTSYAPIRSLCQTAYSLGLGLSST